MISFLKESLWKQFGASIDMLKNAIMLWPEENWNSDRKFYYLVYHTLIFLDYYLTIPPTNFISPLPFTITKPDELTEDAVDDVVPDRIYNKRELLEYLQSCRKKCQKLISDLSEDKIKQRWLEEPDELA
ncbi:MAG: DinB family protein, partial [Ignavibacteria bacterium]|nr:DinB family protein [Ignavibacteria bacterium]